MGQLMPLAKLCTFSQDCFRHWGNVLVRCKHKNCFCLLFLIKMPLEFWWTFSMDSFSKVMCKV